MIRLGAYRINTRALAARLVYRWWWQAGLLALAALGGARAAAVWRGQGRLVVDAPPGATLSLDGGSLIASEVAAGRHTVRARLPDGRVSWASVEIAAGQTLTVTLPVGMAPPEVRPVGPSGPGATLGRIGWSDGAWRVPSLERDTQASAAPLATRRSTSALGPRDSQPLPTLDAFDGLADQVTVDGQVISASYHPPDGGAAAGEIEIAAGGEAVRVAAADPVAWLAWSPDGQALVWAERVATGSEQLRWWRADRPAAPLLAVPGQTLELRWQPGGDAALLLSSDGRALALTLLRLRPVLATRVLAELPLALPSAAAGDGWLAGPALAWSGDTALWVAPDAAGTRRLWQAQLDDGLPLAGPALAADVLALHAGDRGALRLALLSDGQVVLGQLDRDGQLVCRAALPELPPLSGLRGMWSPDGAQLLLQAGSRAWLVSAGEWRP